MIKNNGAARPLALAAALCIIAAPATAQQPRPKHGAAIEVTSRPLPLNPEKPGERQLGALTYMGGIELVSPAQSFGGLSALSVAADQSHILSITDTGQWVCASLVTGKDGMLKGVHGAWMAAMKDPPGFKGKREKDRDSEALTISGNGRHAYVAFEGNHRIWRYDIDDPTDLCSAANTVPTRVPLPPSVDALPFNGGMESLTLRADGTSIIIGEGPMRKTKAHPGWIGPLTDGKGAKMQPFTYISPRPFSPTDVVAVDGGEFILHRHFSVLSGVSGMISYAPKGAIGPGQMGARSLTLGQFAPPISVDNFEGLSALPDGKGGYVLFIVSDDNFSPFQRTLMMKFHLSSQALKQIEARK